MIPTYQRPITSPFDAFSTSAQVMRGVSLHGKSAIVTGGYSGLGLEMTRQLVAAGAGVIVPARDLRRAAEALRDFPGVVVESLDLSDPASIDAFGDRIAASRRPLHLLINSAGIMATPYRRDARGNESQFSTNHLGHFQLTLRLWQALVEAGSARVVSLSSRGHQIAPVDFADVNFVRRPYDKWVAYGQSKSANALFASALDRRGAGVGIRAYSVHPGSILGALARHLSSDEIATFGVHDSGGNVIVDPERDLKTVAQGAATPLWCATSSLLDDIGGVYCENCNVSTLLVEPGFGAGVRPWAADTDLAEQLWHLSERLTGVHGIAE